MNKDENKGLADDQEGEFILNESGTSVTVDADVDFPEDKETTDFDDEASEVGEEPNEAGEDK